MSLFSREERETPFLRVGVSLLYKEAADSSSLERRECLSPLYRGDSSSRHKRESVSLLEGGERERLLLSAEERSLRSEA